MDNYIKYARIFPTMAAMLLPALLSLAFLPSIEAESLSWYYKYLSYITKGVFMLLIISVIVYFLSEVFRYISKEIFQNTLFKRDETEMPTTQLMLWSTNFMSKEIKTQVAIKVKKKFKIHFLSEEEELRNPMEAKRRIVDAVGLIRNVTQGDTILAEHNRSYGFFRNYIGASIWAIILILIILIANCYLHVMPDFLPYICGFIQIVLIGISYFFLKKAGFSYARQLYNTFLTLKYK